MPWNQNYLKTGFQSLSVELGFWIPIIVGFRIPWAVFRIPQTTFPGAGFHRQNVPGFPDSNTL